MLASRTLQAASGGLSYQILKSLRFRAPSLAYLNRTPTSSGNRKTWTWSGWVKRGTLGNSHILFSVRDAGTTIYGYLGMGTGAADALDFSTAIGSVRVQSNAVYRDLSAWYHVVCAVDTTQATAANRVKLFINGVQIISLLNSTYPSLNADLDFNTNQVHALGRYGAVSANYFDGYMAEVNFIDGQALDPTSFGQIDPVSGVWCAKKYTGTYGTNGFYLDFNDITSVNALGYDKKSVSRIFLPSATYVTTATTYTFTVPTYSSNIVVTMWGGGGGGGGGGSTFGNNGSAGTASTFLTLSAGGGGGGTGAWTASPTGSSGAGGTASGGDTNTNGNSIGTSNGATTGAGAPNGGGNTTTATSNAEHYNGTTPGGGATGGRWAGSGNPTGGAGGSGAYVQKTYAVGALTPGTVITVTVGAGGAGGSSDADQGAFGAAGRVNVIVDGGTSGNDWLPNNISLSAGSLYDSMLDVPLGGGGAERGNYCTLNPLDNINPVYVGSQNGNLRGNLGTGIGSYLRGTQGIRNMKVYYECLVQNVGNGTTLGVSGGENALANIAPTGVFYSFTGLKRVAGVDTAYGATYTNNDTIGVAVDGVNGTVEFFKNNVSQGVITDSLISSNILFPYHWNNSSSGFSLVDFNFGQQPFLYTPPSGFVRLHTGNLLVPTVKKPNQYFDATLYTGNNSTQSIINNAGMQPDLVIIKDRTSAYYTGVYDSIRGTGTTKSLSTGLIDAEGTYPNNHNLTSFNANGFSLGATAGINTLNLSGDAFVAWQWRAGGAAVTNNTGSLSASVSANQTVGFSIVRWTGNGVSAQTIGHGLGKIPAMIIHKAVGDSTYNWNSWHKGLSTNYYIPFNANSAQDSSVNIWPTAGITSSVITTTSEAVKYNNLSGVNHIAYVFAEVAGYSKFGSYVGNGSNDGPFVYCGFRPKFILMKRIDSTGHWFLVDTTRAISNVIGPTLFPNLPDVEDTTPQFIDAVSNGFKLRNSSSSVNISGATYIFMVFAETPFKNALAR